ncbi:hypothetical protein E6O75_ATG05964 [Venturia nashicola]|uniref:Uncharacterized protein n=1 Tax=Venturia nashicola TaxID=86259 RepID=A0A4Z1PCJ2_9PEZI|nr:hypothetical protein E6O75_ATG05964 [Venturia nashicola]
MQFQNPSKGSWADLQDVKNWSPTFYFPMNPVTEKAQLCTGGATYLNRISSMAQNSRPDLGFLLDKLERQAKTVNFRSS